MNHNQGLSRSVLGKPLRKNLLSKSIRTATAVLVSGLSAAAIATEGHGVHKDIEEVIVSGALDKSRQDTALPVSIISGDALRAATKNSLGETLSSLPGVQSGTFGTNVGQPIIRGQSGNRVRVLQNNIAVLDAAAASPDHANGISPFAAEKIEVLRGPATLLYGNGAIGGVVNVLDNRIPKAVPEETEIQFLQKHSTYNDQDTSSLAIDGGVEQFAFHVDGTYYESNDYEIPESTFLPPFQDEARRGTLGNSDSDSTNLTAGGSYVFDTGYFGFSVSDLEQEYGLPAAPPGVSDEEGVDIRIDLEQTRYEFELGLEFEGWVESFTAHIGFTDYEHQEIEIEPEEEEEGEEGEEEEEEGPGTVFSNEGFDSRFTINHAPVAGWDGIIGLQVQDREFGAEGAEGFIGETDISSFSIFALETLERGDYIYEVGARVESSDTELSSSCDQSETTFSASGSVLRKLTESTNIWFSTSLSERAATEIELFSNVDGSTCTNPADDELVEHAATRRIEVGNPDLDTETSTNIELGILKHSGSWTGEFNLYYNDISDYIFADFTDDPEIVVYEQQDAEFIGVEASLTHHIIDAENHHLDIILFGDYVEAELDDNNDVPRLAPARIGAELSWVSTQWNASLRLVDVADQTRTGENETETDGYTLLETYVEYKIPTGAGNWAVFAKGNNLLDEDIRDHTSFTKDSAPAPGIGFDLGVRVNF